MENYAPDQMELAPRDLVSRSEQTEIDEGRGVGGDRQGIYLDMTHLGAEKIMNRLPQVRDLALEFRRCRHYRRTGTHPTYRPLQHGRHSGHG